MAAKVRLDALVHLKGHTDSREAARRLILAGLVKVGGEVRSKPGEQVPEDTPVEVTGPAIKFVSRGGQKLEKALLSFGIDLGGAVAADIGASTGGFTDCMLQSGAKHVYAVDVGYGQLAWKLRNDPRVTVMERTNARNLDPDAFAEKPSFASVDVSFISFLKVLPAVLNAGSADMGLVVLVKPQFEAGREKVGKNGVVKDPVVHREVLETAVQGAQGLGLDILGLDYSPVKGPEGNIEYLLHLRKNKAAQEPSAWENKEIIRVVEEAHRKLRGGEQP